MHPPEDCLLNVHTGPTLLEQSYSTNHPSLCRQWRTSQIWESESTLHPCLASLYRSITVVVVLFCFFLKVSQRPAAQGLLFEGCHQPGVIRVMTCTFEDIPSPGSIFLETFIHLKIFKSGKSVLSTILNQCRSWKLYSDTVDQYMWDKVFVRTGS